MLNAKSALCGLLFMTVAGISLLLSCFNNVWADGYEQVAVIVNKDNPATPSVAELKEIFLGERTLWENRESAIHLFLQGKKRPASIVFHHYFFHDHGRKMSRRWVQNIFTGSAPPPVTLKDDEAVIKKIAEDEAAIGYVAADALKDTPLAGGLRVILLFNRKETIPQERSFFRQTDVN